MLNKASYFAPGKLFLAGEYAVTYPQGEAIILPVKIGIQVTIASKKKYEIINLQYPKDSMMFNIISDIPNPYLRLALEVVRQWLEAKKIPWRIFSIKIDSTLVADHGKYGLGSSGAITVALIGALLTFHGVSFTSETLYKLAVVATVQNFQDTSFGDVACSSFAKPIHYRKFLPTMLPLIKTLHVHTLIDMPWEGLLLNPILKLPLTPIVIYSGTSADSHTLVKLLTPHLTSDWVKQSNQYVHTLMTSWDTKVIDAIHRHLQTLATISKAPLFTKGIDAILKIAHACEGVGKFSGAGGGDCTLVFIPPSKQTIFLKQMKKEKYHVLSDII
jgi:phosphomevalonate kinase